MAKRPPYSYPLDRTNERTYADDFDGRIYVWDIDKTYLASEIDSLRGLLAIPLEFAIDKRNVAGTATLLRGLRRGVAPRGLTQSNPIYFVSASPPQLRSVLQRKMLIDGVEYDGITFKDQVALVRKGRFGALREQIGYKLSALLLNRRDLPWTARESLFGDDSESDALIYSLYGDVVAGRLRGDLLVRTLLKNGVRDEVARYAAGLADGMPEREMVELIFINLENRTNPERFAGFSTRLIPCSDTFQMALRLFEAGHISEESTLNVARTLVTRYQRHPPSLLRSAAELVQRRALGLDTLARLWPAMREQDLAPDYFVVDETRLEAHPRPGVEEPGTMLTPESYLATG
ncbi:MAG: hypothetical protein KC635_02025 [Myxococcales bacterium]|nr:hypothetical protein [Myxococcales bacterium]MCB9735629.1 hypothetical protein [Deltaproteobacteria bacterium]